MAHRSTYDVLAFAPVAIPAKVLAHDFVHSGGKGWQPELTSSVYPMFGIKPGNDAFTQSIVDWVGNQPLHLTLFALSVVWTVLFLYCVKRPGEE